MQSFLAGISEAMAIGALVVVTAVLVMGIFILVDTRWRMRGFLGGFAPESVAFIGLNAALGGGLIWLGLHYGFEFHERLFARKLDSHPAQDKGPVASQSVPKQSLACNTVEASTDLSSMRAVAAHAFIFIVGSPLGQLESHGS
jgi:hypothetical protein